MLYRVIRSTLFVSAFALCGLNSAVAEHSTLDAIVVTGLPSENPEVHFTNPVSVISDIDAQAINAVTIEDFVKYEPGLVIRRRYIGDPNGVIGIRGSNMFQTGRSMVFADGLPLHYHLQSRFSGAPRWSLVAPDETASVETVYGPFSALYSGNAMGGVINIQTRFPQAFEFTSKVSTFLQDFSFLGDDENYFGHKEFVSVGNKIGDLSFYISHNHLYNKSHPQSFFNPERASPAVGAAVSGAYPDTDEFGAATIYFGDSGSEQVTTDLSKLKLGYDLGDWFANLTLAYEERDRDADKAKPYIRDNAGNLLYRGDYSFNGRLFDSDGRFGNFYRVAYEERETLLVGGELSGPVANGLWNVKMNFSVFDVIKDQRLRSDENPSDPTFDASGRIREFDDTGWETTDLKLSTDHLFNREDMRLTLGYHYDHYKLKVAEFTAVGDFRNGVTGAIRNNNPSAGQTHMHAGFAELAWQFTPDWDLVVGGRFEAWESTDAQKGTDFFADRSEEKFSPKLAIGFNPEGPWSYRYSVARAYRFPLAEELFENKDDTLGTTIANIDLKPEDGMHHNVSIQREIQDGMISLNIFHEVIDDVIFNQTELVSNVTTFLNLDEVTTTGAELIGIKESIFELPLDVRANLAYTHAEVTRNSLNPATEGKQFPRMPAWRANLLVTYHIIPDWDFSTGLRFASDSHGQLDNSDIAEEVFGAQDGYVFVDLKTQYQWNKHLKISAGIDNVSNEKAFVFHPWPQRSYYLEASVKF